MKKFFRHSSKSWHHFGFTLVELIIVVTILAILATIAFISLQGQTVSARDSARVADLTNANKGLENYLLRTGRLPEPSAWTGVTFSGAQAWKQGTFGDSVVRTLSSAGIGIKKMTDPKYPTIEYTYSITTNPEKEYQIATALENQTAFSPIISPAFAATVDRLIAKTEGNYNGGAVKVSTGNIIYVLALPSIILKDITNTKLDDGLTQSGNIVLNGKGNLPSGYTNSLSNPVTTPSSDQFTYTPLGNGNQTLQGSGIVAYIATGTILELTGTGLAIMTDNLKKIYASSEVGSYAFGISSASVINTATGSNATTVGKNITKSIGGILVKSPSEWAVASVVTRYPGCDTDDIVLTNGQVWAACNVGADTAFNEALSGTTMSVTLANSTAAGGPTAAQKKYMGAFFQWGRNVDVTTGANVAGPLAPAAAASSTSFIKNSAGTYDWLNPQDNNLWGWNGTIFNNGTYTSQGSPASMQGPCASGYHVPTSKEWCDAISAIVPALTCNSMLQAGAEPVFAKLKIPLVGVRIYSTAAYTYQNLQAYFWTATPWIMAPEAQTINFSWGTSVNPVSQQYRAFGLSVRCVKN